MPQSDTGERVTPVLDFPAPDGRVNAVRVDYTPGGYTYVYVMEGSVVFAIDGGEPFVLKTGESYYEPPGVEHSVSRNASGEVPASIIAFFVLADGVQATVYDGE